VSERKGQRTLSCADLHDELAGPETGVDYKLLSPPGKKEILTETATSLVSVAPPSRGHEAPPLHPCGICIRSDRVPQRLGP
jgi:hypothetical protein